MPEISIEVEEGVARLTLEAADRRNALTTDMAQELIAACQQIDANHKVGAVVVSGGSYFCAGAHRSVLAEAGDDPTSDRSFFDLGIVYRAFTRVGELEPPTIAAVRGGAVGAGVNLALATDLRVVADDAKIASGFLRLGLHPGGGHFGLAARAGGRETAAAMGLFGAQISGRRAFELGMAWEAVTDEEVEPAALELARPVAADPALARRAARSMRLEVGPPAVAWPAGLEIERGAQMWSLGRRS